MIVVVSDTSVLIDLERGAFLEAAFSLSFDLAVPDLLYARELKDYGGEKLLKLGLRVESLGDRSTAQAVRYWKTHPALSLPDCFALSLAEEKGWTLLTGDGGLRDLTDSQSIDCHGVLWVLDELLREAIITPKLLHEGLETIARHPRCRLPKREMQTRLEMYKKLAAKKS